MAHDTSTEDYSGIAKILHWSTFIAVVAALILGVMIANSGWAPVKSVLATLVGITGNKVGMVKGQLYDLHRSFGALVLGLFVLRIVWRFVSPPPPLPDTVPAWQRSASRVVHGLLYLCLIVMPLLGWTGTSLYGAKIKVFGLFVLPAIVAKDRGSYRFVLDMHDWLALAFGVIIVLHIGAALMHHFVKKDDILRRMLPGKRR